MTTSERKKINKGNLYKIFFIFIYINLNQFLNLFKAKGLGRNVIEYLNGIKFCGSDH